MNKLANSPKPQLRFVWFSDAWFEADRHQTKKPKVSISAIAVAATTDITHYFLAAADTGGGGGGGGAAAGPSSNSDDMMTKFGPPYVQFLQLKRKSHDATSRRDVPKTQLCLRHPI